jgi:hypothetical protein
LHLIATKYRWGSWMGTLDVDGTIYPIESLVIWVRPLNATDTIGISVDVWNAPRASSEDLGVTLNCLSFFGVTDFAEICDRELVLGEELGVELGESVFFTPDHETLEIDALALKLVTSDGELVAAELNGYCRDHYGNENLAVRLVAPASLKRDPP